MYLYSDLEYHILFIMYSHYIQWKKIEQQIKSTLFHWAHTQPMLAKCKTVKWILFILFHIKLFTCSYTHVCDNVKLVPIHFTNRYWWQKSSLIQRSWKPHFNASSNLLIIGIYSAWWHVLMCPLFKITCMCYILGHTMLSIFLGTEMH